MNITEDGKKAILDLAGGDMRRVLNLLQACSMAHSKTDETSVYLTAGAAAPKTVAKIFHSLMNDSFEQAHTQLQEIMRSQGYALSDVLTSLSAHVLDTAWPDPVLAYIMDQMSTIGTRPATATQCH